VWSVVSSSVGPSHRRRGNLDQTRPLPYACLMLALQKIMTVPAGRRLRLDEPLPDAVNTGRMEVKVFIQPLPACPPRKKRDFLAQLERVRKEHQPKPLHGLIKGQGVTVASFLAEKRADDAIEFAREGR